MLKDIQLVRQSFVAWMRPTLFCPCGDTPYMASYNMVVFINENIQPMLVHDVC